MALEVTLEDYVAPERAPHKYASIVEQLIQAGPNKVATVEVDSEDDAKRFLTDMQSAAREQGHSAVKRALVQDGKKYRISVAVRDKITRTRKPKDD